MITMGIPPVSSLCSSLSISKPPNLGSIRSRRMRSGLPARALVSASSPSAAFSTRKPSFLTMNSMSSRTESSSSTISIILSAGLPNTEVFSIYFPYSGLLCLNIGGDEGFGGLHTVDAAHFAHYEAAQLVYGVGFRHQDGVPAAEGHIDVFDAADVLYLLHGFLFEAGHEFAKDESYHMVLLLAISARSTPGCGTWFPLCSRSSRALLPASLPLPTPGRIRRLKLLLPRSCAGRR